MRAPLTPPVSAQNIKEAARQLDLSGRPLCVHASLRSFGWVQGGAGAIVEGLLAQGCTVMVPAFSWSFAVLPPPEMRPPRNGWDYDQTSGDSAESAGVFSPDTQEIDADMGAIPAAVVSMESRIRGNHPLCSFSAVGAVASELIAGQMPLDVYAPLAELASRRGAVILMGVGLEQMTLLHLAEKVAGRILFRRWANGPDGRPMQVEVGGCSGGFGKLAPHLMPTSRTAQVGLSTWTVFDARRALQLAAAAIRVCPNITHCGDAACGRCRDAVLGGPIMG